MSRDKWDSILTSATDALELEDEFDGVPTDEEMASLDYAVDVLEYLGLLDAE